MTDNAQIGEYTVLETNAQYDVAAIEWGWGGFTAKDLHRATELPRTVALAYDG